jgi:hypothetical protein
MTGNHKVQTWQLAAALAAAALVGFAGGVVVGETEGRAMAASSACQYWCDEHTRGLGLVEYQACVARCAEWRCR